MADLAQALRPFLTDPEGFRKQPVLFQIPGLPDPTRTSPPAPTHRCTVAFKLPLKNVGHGSYGTIYELQDPLKVAKVIALKDVHVTRASHFLMEVSVMKSLRHRHLQHVDDIVLFPALCPKALQPLFAENGSPLTTIILVQDRALGSAHDRPPQTVEAFWRMAYHTLLGLEALHGAQVLHRDLKPHNVLLYPDRAVLTDFGFATQTSEWPKRTCVYSESYQPPEITIAADKKEPCLRYNTASDIWAWAAMVASLARQGHSIIQFATDKESLYTKDLQLDRGRFFQLLAAPHHTRVSTKTSVIEGTQDLLWDWLSPALQFDPSQRPNARQLREFLEQRLPRIKVPVIHVTYTQRHFPAVWPHPTVRPKVARVLGQMRTVLDQIADFTEMKELKSVPHLWHTGTATSEIQRRILLRAMDYWSVVATRLHPHYTVQSTECLLALVFLAVQTWAPFLAFQNQRQHPWTAGFVGLTEDHRILHWAHLTAVFVSLLDGQLLSPGLLPAQVPASTIRYWHTILTQPVWNPLLGL